MRVDRIFIAFSALILVLAGTYIYACHSPTFNVTQITVQGNQKVTSDQIRSRLEPYLNRNMLGLNIGQMESLLRTDIRLKDVRIKRRLPGLLLIEVREKQPVLWVSLPAELPEFGDYGFCGLSLDQEVIPLDKEDLSHDLPMVSGISGSDRTPTPYREWTNERVQKALQLYTTFAEIDPASAGLISEINLQDPSNPVLYLLPSVKVIMGEGNYEKKWRRVRTILDHEKDLASFSCLDLRFDDQVLLTRSSSYKLITPTGESTETSEKD
jgi:cell division septal protein FtsQ